MGAAECDEAASGARSSRPAPLPCKGKRAGGKKASQVGPRAPQLKEPWRKEAKARQLLAEPAVAALNAFLDETISVVPQGGAPSLPTITITPAEIIRHILSRMSFFVAEAKPGASIFAEIYGGVAQSVVAVNNGLPAVTPTDFDARFYIPRVYNDARDFDRCRCIVEEFLVMKLRLALDGSDAELLQKAPNLVRTRYFQKQVVIGGALSLLSCGDPASGKGVDLEFSLNVAGDRKYFDDANSFVIPLSLQRLAGIEQVYVLSMARNFEHALALASSGELLVGQPAQVVNGLSLYAHALSDKGLTPAGINDEEGYGCEMVKSFMDTCRGLRDAGKDPLRFVKSFIRSHYPGRPLAGLAMVAQIMAELAAFVGKAGGKGDEEEALRSASAQLFSAQMLAAVESLDADPGALHSLLTITCFVRSPGNVAAAAAAERSIHVTCEKGRPARLLRKHTDCGLRAGLLCQRAAAAVRERCEHEPAVEAWKQGVLEGVCHMLESPGLEEERRGGAEAEAAPAQAPAATTTAQRKRVEISAAAAPPPAPAAAPAAAASHAAALLLSAAPRRPVSYAAAALAAHGNTSNESGGPERARGSAWPPPPPPPSPPPLAANKIVCGEAAAERPVEEVDVVVRPLPRVAAVSAAVAHTLAALGRRELAAALVAAGAGSPCGDAVITAQAPGGVEEGVVEHVAEGCAGSSELPFDCDTPRADDMCVGEPGVDWPSPTRSTDYAWTLPHRPQPPTQCLPAVQASPRHACPGPPLLRPRVTVTIDALFTPSGADDPTSVPSSPFSTSSLKGGSGRACSSTSSSPLFTYRGLFESPADEPPVVQLDEPLFRLPPAELARTSYDDSDLDSHASDSGALPQGQGGGADTPTSSASSSNSFASGASSAATSDKSDLALETLVRSLLGHDNYVVDQNSRLSTSAKDYSMTKDYRWDLADCWATSGLRSFPAPWKTD